MKIRPAEPADSRDIWAWRNDPEARRMFVNTAEVPWPQHEAWFASFLARQDGSRMYVGMVNNERIGMVRFDACQSDSSPTTDLASTPSAPIEFEVSINMNPTHRGRGLGTRLLGTAIAAFDAIAAEQPPSRLHAKIKRDNIASLKAFTKNGFETVSKDADFVSMVRAVAGTPRIPGTSS